MEWPQSTFGLWRTSQGWPRTTRASGDSVSRSVSLSVWFSWSDEGDRASSVIQGRVCPLSALTEILWVRGTMGICRCWAKLMSIKLPSAPESKRAWQLWTLAAHCSLTGGELWMRISPGTIHPTVTSALLSGLAFYRTVSQEVTRSTAI